MKGFEIYVNYGNGGYSFAVKTSKELTQEEIIKRCLELDLFEDETDIMNIENFEEEPIEYLENHFKVISLDKEIGLSENTIKQL